MSEEKLRELILQCDGYSYAKGMVVREHYRGEIDVRPYEIPKGSLPPKKSLYVIEFSAVVALKARVQELEGALREAMKIISRGKK